MIIYASRTGNVRYIVSKLNLSLIEITESLIVNKPYIIFTYTDKLGEVPKKVEDFLQQNHQFCKGVIASGNSNFGKKMFCESADKISKQYNVPIIHKVELRGFQYDYDLIVEKYNKLIQGE